MLLAAVIVAFIVSVAPASVRAQTPREASAALAFQRGAAAMQGGRCEEAIGFFSESYRLAPASNTLYNVAHCHRELGHVRFAVQFYEQYLSEAGSEVGRSREQALRALLVDLRARLAVVGVQMQPFDTALIVDGNRVRPSQGEVLLDPGSHTLFFTAPGHASERRVVDARAGEHLSLDIVLLREGAAAPPPAVPVVEAPIATPPPVLALPPPAATPHLPTEPMTTRSAPIYTRWWFWTGVAVVVAGGVTATVLAVSGTTAPQPADLHFETLRVR